MAVPDEKAILGTWEVVSSTFSLVRKLPRDEDVAPEQVFKSTKVIITDDAIKIVGPNVTARAFEYRLNPAAKTKMIDLQTSGSTDFGLFSYGIYEWEGGNLKICASGLQGSLGAEKPKASDVRPTEFWAELGSAKEMLVLRRVGDAVVTDDEKAILGTWRVEEAPEAAGSLGFTRGQKIAFSRHVMSLSVTRNDRTMTSDGFLKESPIRVEETYGYVLDPTVAPKKVDIFTTASQLCLPLHGVYELNRDRLTIAFRSMPERYVAKDAFPHLPPDFEEGPSPPSTVAAGPNTWLVVLKRVDDATAKARRPQDPPEKAKAKPAPPQAAAPVSKPAVVPDEKAIQGTWEVVSSSFSLVKKLPRDEGVAPEQVLKSTKVIITADAIKIVGPSVSARAYRYQLNPTAKTKMIDLQTPGSSGFVSYGIYECEGGNLKICTSGLRRFLGADEQSKASALRPTEFWAELGSAKEMLVLRRVADAVVTDDEKAILGTWQVEEAPEAAGSLGFTRGRKIAFSRHGMSLSATPKDEMEGGLVRVGATYGYVLDPTVVPKRIGIATMDAALAFFPLHGVYELNRDRLTIAFTAMPKKYVEESGFVVEGPSPPSTVAAGPNTWLVVLKRVDDATAKARRPQDPPEKAEAKPAPPQAAAPDEKAILGTWEVVSSTFSLVKKLPRDEGVAPEQVFKSTKVIITDDAIKIVGPNVAALAFKYRLNPAAKTKMIDLQPPENVFGFVSYGIYEWEGGNLKICTSSLQGSLGRNPPKASDRRPTEFWAELNSVKELLVLRRVADAVVTDDEKAIQGTWQVEEAPEAAGGVVGFTRGGRVVFSRDGMSMSFTHTEKNEMDGRLVSYGVTYGYVLDPTAAPKRIDIVATGTPSLSPLYGVYKLNRDRLTIAFTAIPAEGVEEAPPSTVAAGPNTWLVVLKRVDDATAKARRPQDPPEKAEAKPAPPQAAAPVSKPAAAPEPKPSATPMNPSATPVPKSVGSPPPKSSATPPAAPAGGPGKK
jgi:uncharacterized protein (TIGR03067 family)